MRDEYEMYKTPRVFLFPKTQTITSKGTTYQSSAINQSSALSAEFHSRPRMPSYIVIIDADIQLLVASEDAN